MGRDEELWRWKGKCGCCEMRIKRNDAAGMYLFERDHFVPISMGGADNKENTWCLCLNCHRKKTQMERIERFQKLWCPLCSHYYEGDHGCFKELLLTMFPKKEYNPIDEKLPHPDTWEELFQFHQPAKKCFTT